MSNPRQHHYVPKVYLRNFCYDKKQEHLYAYDKHTKKAFTPHIENIAQERDYNTVTALEDKYYYEKYFSSNVEPELGKLLDRIISKSILSYGNAEIIDEKTREGLSKMLAFQIFRTLNARKYISDELDSFTAPYINEILQIPEISKYSELRAIAEEHRSINEVDMKEFYLPMSVDESRLIRHISLIDNMLCTFYDNKTDEYFITSDCPVVVRRMQTKEIGLGVACLSRTDSVITYPLNPNLATVLYHRNSIFAHCFKAYENRRCPITQVEIVRTLNKWQFWQAHRQVYSKAPISCSNF